MPINLGEILQLLAKVEALGSQLIDSWKKIQEHSEQVADTKKREKLLEACKNRDASAVRELWFSLGDN